jgi:hypothetical protein
MSEGREGETPRQEQLVADESGISHERLVQSFQTLIWEQPHSIGFSGKRIVSYGKGRSTLDLPLIHEVQSQDQP